MALVDRIGPSGDISSHAFSAGIYLVSRGLVTRQQFVTRFGLSPEDETQLDQLVTHYNGLNAENKAAFHGKFESLNILREEEYINLTEYKNLLGLT